jgi:hypothetical protein
MSAAAGLLIDDDRDVEVALRAARRAARSITAFHGA